MAMQPPQAPGKQGIQPLHPASGPHPQGNPKDEHKILGPTHPELFSGKGGIEGSAAEEAGESPAFERAEEKMLPNKGMSSTMKKK